MAEGSWTSAYADVEVTDDGRRIVRLHAGLGASEESLKQCRAANRILGSLKDERILSADDVAVTEGRLTLHTPAVAARPVGERFSSGLSVDQAVHILEQTCEAIDAAQGLGVLHGALTPGCVLVDDADTPQVWVTNFGLAHVFPGGATGEGPAQWHPLRPETMLASPPTPATDVYLLGNLAVGLLTGRPAFEGDEASGLARRHSIEDVPRLDSLPSGRDVPSALSRIVERCLHKEPEERFSSAAQLARTLRTHRERGWSTQDVQSTESDDASPLELASNDASVAQLRAKLTTGTPSPSDTPTLQPDESLSRAIEKATAPSGTPTLERRISSVKMELLRDGGSTEAAMEVDDARADRDASASNDSDAPNRRWIALAGVAGVAVVAVVALSRSGDGPEAPDETAGSPTAASSPANKPKPTPARGPIVRKPKPPSPDEQAKELTQRAATANRAGNADDAVGLYQQALEVKRDYAPAAFGLSGIFLERDEYEEAARYGVMATNSSPDSAKYQLHLGDIYAEMGNKQDAVHHWKTAAELGDPTAQKRLK